MFSAFFGIVSFILAVSVLPSDCKKATVTSKAPGVKKYEFTQFQKDALKIHNDLREIHHADALELDADLCKEAEEQAKKWIDGYLKTGQFQRPPGEEEQNTNDNVWSVVGFSSFKVTASKILEPWVNQAKDHDFAGAFNPKTAHFSQMVWKSTDSLGATVVSKSIGKGKHKRFITVGIFRYAPAGNVNTAEQFQDNVLQP